MGYRTNDQKGCLIRNKDEIVVVDGPCRVQEIAYVQDIKPKGFTSKEMIRISDNENEENEHDFMWSAWVEGNGDAVGHIRDILYHIDTDGIFMKSYLQYPPVKIIEEYLK